MAQIGITRETYDGAGGIKYVLASVFTEGMVSTTAKVATITGGAFYKYVTNKHSSNVTNTFGMAVETGSAADAQAGTLVFAKLSAEKQAELEELSKHDLLVIAVDFNGVGIVLGAEEGCNLTAIEAGTGTAHTDMNGYTVTITGDETKTAPVIAEADLPVVTA